MSKWSIYGFVEFEKPTLFHEERWWNIGTELMLEKEDKRWNSLSRKQTHKSSQMRPTKCAKTFEVT